MAEEYGNRVADVVNKGCVAIMLSMARQAGILDVLKSASKPVTSREIAAEKALKERYVRELMGSLCASRLVHVGTNDHGETVYHLTEEEKACYSKSSHLWPFIGVPGCMGLLYRQSLQTFDLEGPYGFHYGPEIHQVMEDFSIAGVDNAIESFLKNVPGLEEKLKNGIDVAEFGCGRGYVLSKLALRFPNSRFTASEYSAENVNILRSKYGHIPNMTFARHDLCDPNYEDDKQYDWTYENDVIHDLSRPKAAVEKLRKMTKKDGVCVLKEPSLTETGKHEEGVGDPTVASFFAMSVFTCLPEGFENDDSATMGPVYGKHKMKELALEAGFHRVTCSPMSPEYSVYVCYQM